MNSVQQVQLAFVVFTFAQIACFIFIPEVYEPFVGGLEGGPHFTSFRLIGVKEIGLMSFYIAGIYLNDSRVAYLTAFGRLSVLVFTPIMIFYFNAPQEIVGGIFQDILGSASTLYFLRRNHQEGPRRRHVLLVSSLLPRFVLLGSGAFEFLWGLHLFLRPLETSLVPREAIFGPEGFGLQGFGFMSMLCGFYQMSVAVLFEEVDGVVLLAWGFFHLNFYLGARFGLSSVVDLSPSVLHLYFGMGISLMVAVSALISLKKKKKKA